jgi:GDP-D-mannose dehydratase
MLMHLGALRILEAIRFHKLESKTKFYQAGSSEMFGKVLEVPQNEKHLFIQEVHMVLLKFMHIGLQ